MAHDVVALARVPERGRGEKTDEITWEKERSYKYQRVGENGKSHMRGGKI
jgi:hypothetical protein